MDFSTKALEEISTILAEEISKLIEEEEIKDVEELESGIREILKEIGFQTCGKVLEKEDEKLGKRVRCECGGTAKRISKRETKVMTISRAQGSLTFPANFMLTKCSQSTHATI